MANVILREIFKGDPAYQLFGAPRPGRSVWPHQGCPCFTPRESLFLRDPDRECWYCAHADFHLDREVALDVGICLYPEIFRAKRLFETKKEENP